VGCQIPLVLLSQPLEVDPVGVMPSQVVRVEAKPLEVELELQQLELVARVLERRQQVVQAVE